jgi:hypothetical protein
MEPIAGKRRLCCAPHQARFPTIASTLSEPAGRGFKSGA